MFGTQLASVPHGCEVTRGPQLILIPISTTEKNSTMKVLTVSIRLKDNGILKLRTLTLTLSLAARRILSIALLVMEPFLLNKGCQTLAQAKSILVTVGKKNVGSPCLARDAEAPYSFVQQSGGRATVEPSWLDWARNQNFHFTSSHDDGHQTWSCCEEGNMDLREHQQLVRNCVKM